MGLEKCQCRYTKCHGTIATCLSQDSAQLARKCELQWCYDTQNSVIWNNDTKHNTTQLYDTVLQHSLSSVIMQCFCCAQFCHTVCHYAEYCYAESCYTNRPYTICHCIVVTYQSQDSGCVFTTLNFLFNLRTGPIRQSVCRW